MRTTMRQNLVPFSLLVLLVLAPLSGVSARTVHETATVDLLPQGEFNDANAWTLDAYTSFSEESALYTESMVADSRLTMVHERPVNLACRPHRGRSCLGCRWSVQRHNQ